MTGAAGERDAGEKFGFRCPFIHRRALGDSEEGAGFPMGESQMGRFGFSSWTLHMASIIIFGTCWGFAFKEWKDAAPAVRRMVWSGVGLLIFATMMIGYGNRLAV